MITTQPEELMEKWLSMIPGGRTCKPEELKGVGPPVLLHSLTQTFVTSLHMVIDLYVSC